MPTGLRRLALPLPRQSCSPAKRQWWRDQAASPAPAHGQLPKGWLPSVDRALPVEGAAQSLGDGLLVLTACLIGPSAGRTTGQSSGLAKGHSPKQVDTLGWREAGHRQDCREGGMDSLPS